MEQVTVNIYTICEIASKPGYKVYYRIGKTAIPMNS